MHASVHSASAHSASAIGVSANSPIVNAYRRATTRSAELYREACEVFPSGVTHDSRYLEPHPIYVERAQGSRKWDVDGREYVDYSGGHGALLLGHRHPAVTAAVAEQLARGTHFGAGHAGELRWGQSVQRLLPSAERLRFTSSGTEATLLAIRLARAFTGRRKLLRFAGHFHGWHDHVVAPAAGAPASPGVLAELAHQVLVVPAGDLDAVRAVLASDHDVAAVLVEPTGASWGQAPLAESFLHGLREMTAARGVLLVFDEVISGFRCAPGGAQACLGIRPDLTTLAKILAGGLPGGAVAGRSELFEALDFPPPDQSRAKIPHHGTFNANPLSAAAGIATLELVATGEPCQQANDYAARLREALAREVRDAGAPWVVYGSYSSFHLFTNPDRRSLSAAEIESGRVPVEVLKNVRKSLSNLLRLAMLLGQVEIFSWPGGPTSAVHNQDDLERTTAAFGDALRMLKAEGAWC